MLIIRVIFLSTLFAVVTAASQSAAGDWPEFRGPTGDGISTAANVPVEWSVTNNVTWQQEVPGIGWSSPVLVCDKIYLTTATGSAADGDVSLRVLSLNASDGQILWNVEVLRPSAEAAGIMHQKNSLASSTPIVADNRLYAHFGHMGTAALDLDGCILWEQTKLNYTPMHGNGGSPAIVDDTLVFSCDGDTEPFVAALNRYTGEVRWKQPRETPASKKFSFSTPLVLEVDGATQIISPGSGFTAAYDPRDGHELWRVNYGEGFSVVPRPVAAHGLVYLCSGFIRASVIAVDPQGASGDVTDTHVRWKYDRGVPTTPSILVVGDEVYFVSDNGVGTCLDAHSGKVNWTQRLGGNFSASPVLAEGRLYFLSEEGITHVVRAGKEFEVLAKNELGERSLASPAVGDGAIYLRTESHLWRIGAPGNAPSSQAAAD